MEDLNATADDVGIPHKEGDEALMNTIANDADKTIDKTAYNTVDSLEDSAKTVDLKADISEPLSLMGLLGQSVPAADGEEEIDELAKLEAEIKNLGVKKDKKNKIKPLKPKPLKPIKEADEDAPETHDDGEVDLKQKDEPANETV
jgi:hypothetical protein